MRQTGTVTGLLPDGFAEVTVNRGTACSGNCSSCGGCGAESGTVNIIVAENSMGAVPGQRVIIESSTGKVMKAAILAYILPILCLLAGYAIPSALGLKEGFCILFAFLTLALGMLLLAGEQKNRKKLTCKIIHLGGTEKM